MTTLALSQSRPLIWSLPGFPQLRLAALFRRRNYPGARRARMLAGNRWLGDYVRHQH